MAVRYQRPDASALPATSGRLPGVNVSGYLRAESGLGQAARGYVRALRTLGIPVALNDLSELQPSRADDPTFARFDDDHPHDLNLVCVNPDQHFGVLLHLGEEVFRDRYNIAVWAWELQSFPEKWRDRFAYYDEIWVGTSFIATALAPISPVPVVRIPPVLSAGVRGSRSRGRRRLGVAVGEFVYLYIFDFHSQVERKNPMALIDAFKLAFRPSDRARLVVKCANGRSDAGSLAELKARAEGHRVSIHDGYWTSAEMRDLMAACDAYVSLHRAEGTGLTISDAMASGKPVIATAWSGNMDFMTVANSFPVRYTLVELRENLGPYHAGEFWAEPSLEHAAAQMRRVFENRDEARARGRAARQEIMTNYSEAKVASLIQQRLRAIELRRRFSEFKRRVWGWWAKYRHLPEAIREVVRTAVPADATVVVVSKGDDELLKLDGRRAWHFPRLDDGRYAGYYPADSTTAIEHLEDLRARGGDFLLFPSTALWWLEHYAGLRQHLERHYRLIVHQPETCTIFALRETVA